jgi:hypothetical protein
MSAIAGSQRFMRRNPCPICGGGDDMPRGKGQRCSGYLSSDGRYAFCTREEHAGRLKLQDTDPASFRHLLEGDCWCGVQHAAPANWNGRGEIVATYDYTDVKGEALFQVARFAPKRFLQRRPDGHGDWIWNLEGVERVPYRLPRLQTATLVGGTIHIAEGEKDVDALEKTGAVATCNPGGAGKWRDPYSKHLSGAGEIIVIADKDEQGHEHALAVADSLRRVLADSCPPIRIVQAKTGKDAADHLAAGHGLHELEPIELSREAEATETEATETSFEIRVYSARELVALEPASKAEPIAGPFVRRAMVTLVAGITGHGKTTLIAQLIARAVLGGDTLGHDAPGGARALVLDLEQHLESIQRVIRAAGLADSDIVDYAPIPEGLALDTRTDQLDELERVLAAKPYDIVAIDPFYKLHEADSNDERQARLLVALLRRWIKEHGFALLTATHCRKLPAGRNVITLDDLFGSSLFTRDPELVLGLQRHAGLTKLHVFKSREPGLDYGQTFDLIYGRDRGFYLKPDVDPEERAARLAEVRQTARQWIASNPGQSTNTVKKAVATLLKCGGDLVDEALCHEVKSGLLPEPLKGSRKAKLWYPLNHAALTSPETLLGEVTETARRGQNETTSPDLPDFPVGEREGQGSEVDEAETDQLATLREDTSL